MSVRRNVFGTLGEDQRIVHKYDLENASGLLRVTVTDYGATLLSVQTPDRNGELEEITLNHYDDLQALANPENKPYLGCIAGRYANRIAKGKFSLDGEEYQLAINNGENHLHGGLAGFDTKIWESDILEEGRCGVRFTLHSPHMDEGYPGHLCVVVEYEIIENELQIHTFANTSAPTVVNLTNHAYWNLSGEGKRLIYSHMLHLASHHFLEVDKGQIPTGKLQSVVVDEQANSETTKSEEESIENSQKEKSKSINPFEAFDFVSENLPKRLSQEMLMTVDGGGQPGLDHCFVVDGYEINSSGSEKKTLLDVGTLLEPESGRAMVIRSTQPGVQVYTANWLPKLQSETDKGAELIDEEEAEKRKLFQQHNAICLETQHFPDSPNHPEFPSTVIRPHSETAGKVTVPTPDRHDFYELTVFKFHVLN